MHAKQQPRRWGPSLRRASLALALVVALVGCGTTVVNPVTGQAERTVMSEEDEIAQGQRAHQQVLQEYGVVANPALQEYVNALGQRLARHSHRSQLQWHFTVLDSPDINAFALPGGYVYVTRGILAYMESEADLAGVLGHEIGHVTARHGAQRATTEQSAGLGVLAANILGTLLETQGVTGAGRLAGQVSQTVAAGYVARYGREQELQADGLGAEYLARNQYDPRNMIDVIRVLKDQDRYLDDLARAQGRAAPARNDWLASHPSSDQRLEAITQLAAQYSTQRKYADEGRERYLAVLRGIEFGDSAAQGLVRGRQFLHTGLGIAITAPQDWQLQNGSDRLTLVNAASDAVLTLRLAPAAAGSTPAEVLRNLLKPSQGRSESTSINGLPALRFVGARQNAQGQLQALEATVIAGPQGHFYVLQYGARDANALARARAPLREAEGSFRALTEADRALARPWQIRTTAYPKGGFAELARSSPLPHAEKQLRLINGYYSGGEPPVGQLVKVVALP